MLRIECEECGEALQADVSMRGETAQCPACGAQITIPLAAETAPTFDQQRDFGA